LIVMPDVTSTDRLASRAEVLEHRERLADLARANGLTEVRADAAGVVIVHSEAPGYASVRRFAAAASSVVGAWVNVVTDDVPAARTSAEPL
jgi:hypothetical protein